MYKLLKFGVRRIADGACIPDAAGNSDWRKYQEWLAAGGVPEPADPDPIPDPRKVLDTQECEQAKIHAQTITFLNMTPAELDAWCDANLPAGGTRTMGKVLGRLAQNAARGKTLR